VHKKHTSNLSFGWTKVLVKKAIGPVNIWIYRLLKLDIKFCAFSVSLLV
jgi:hypothetical protein